MVPDWIIFVFGCGVTTMVGLGAYRIATGHSRGSVASFLAESFPRFHRAVLAEPGLSELLCAPRDLTVFVTPDYACDKLSATGPASAGEHVVFGRVTASDLKGRSELTTIDGRTLVVSNGADDQLLIGGARFVNTDYECEDGIVHVVDRPLHVAAQGADLPEGSGEPALGSEADGLQAA